MLVLNGPLVVGKDTAVTVGTNSAKSEAANRNFSAILNIVAKYEGNSSGWSLFQAGKDEILIMLL